MKRISMFYGMKLSSRGAEPIGKSISVVGDRVDSHLWVASSEDLEPACGDVLRVAKSFDTYNLYKFVTNKLSSFYADLAVRNIGFPGNKLLFGFRSGLEYAIGVVLRHFCGFPFATLLLGYEPRLLPSYFVEDSICVPIPLLLDEDVSLMMVLEAVMDSFRKELLASLSMRYLPRYLDMEESIVREVLSQEPRVVESRSSLREVEEGLELERRGRELAYMLAEVGQLSDRDLENVGRWAEEVLDFLNYVKSRSSENPFILSLARRLSELFERILIDAKHGVLSTSTVETLRELDDEMRAIGAGSIVWGTLDSWSAVVNSATAALHRFVEMLQDLRSRRFLILSDDPNAVRWVARFLQTFEAMQRAAKKNPSYVLAEEDLENTSIVVTKSEIIARLGSFDRHATHVDLKKGVLVYYDNDDLVKLAMLELIKRFVNVKHYVEYSDRLVVYFDPTPENIEKLCAILPIAISMDYRAARNVLDPASDDLRKLQDEVFTNPRKVLEDVVKMLGSEYGLSAEDLINYAKKLRNVFASAKLQDFEKYLESSRKPTLVVDALDRSREVVEKYILRGRR